MPSLLEGVSEEGKNEKVISLEELEKDKESDFQVPNEGRAQASKRIWQGQQPGMTFDQISVDPAGITKQSSASCAD